MAQSPGPTIIRQLQPWGAMIDENVTFTVTVSSKKDLTFTWKLNGKTIRQEDEIKQTESHDGKTSTIWMRFSPTKHAGMYKCVVTEETKGESLTSNEVELRDFADEVKIMQKRPIKKELLIVIIGRAGMGKSSLFNSLVGKKIAKEGHSSRPVTETVMDELHNINGIDVRLVDTPGFGALHGGKTTDIMKTIAEKIPNNGADVNLVIYCTSMSPDARLNTTDGEIVKQLTKTYDQNLWENTLVAMTFANTTKRNQEVDTAVQATKFNEIVADYTKSIQTDLLKNVGEVCDQVAQTIPILPVGYFTFERGKSQQECCILPDGSNWLSNFWYQSLIRIRDPQARYAFYRATCNIHPYLRENEHRKLFQE